MVPLPKPDPQFPHVQTPKANKLSVDVLDTIRMNIKDSSWVVGFDSDLSYSIAPHKVSYWDG